MGEHVPGPWGCEYENTGNGGLTEWWSVETGDAHIAKVAGEDNARLIAKAWLIPELVEALEDLIPRFVKCAVASGTDKEFAEAAVEKHRAVLARANQPES